MWLPSNTLLGTALLAVALWLSGCDNGGGDEGTVTPVKAVPIEGANPYYLIVEAGVSGSKLRMYNVTQGVEPGEIVPAEEDADSFKVKPGMADFVSKPSGYGATLQGLMEAASKYIPAEERNTATLIVKGSSTLRMMDASKLEAVVKALDTYMENPDNCPFKYAGAEVISGEQAAVFSWIGLNFLNDGAILDADQTAGVLDMGGYSMQAAFRPEGPIKANKFSFYLGSKRTSLYAKTFVKFGLSVAMERAKLVLAAEATGSEVDHPCLHKGVSEEATVSGKKVTFTGTGDNDKCDNITSYLLHEEYACMMEPCSIMGTYFPEVSSSKRFYAIANFFYIANGLGLVDMGESQTLTPQEIEDATRKFCKLEMKDAKAQSEVPWEYRQKHCFGGHFIRNIFRALGFEDAHEVDFVQGKSEGKSAHWTYGATVYEMQYMPRDLAAPSSPCKEESPPATVQEWEQGHSTAPVLSRSIPLWPLLLAASCGVNLLQLVLRRRAHSKHPAKDSVARALVRGV